jgi:hypothetical protein
VAVQLGNEGKHPHPWVHYIKDHQLPNKTHLYRATKEGVLMTLNFNETLA